MADMAVEIGSRAILEGVGKVVVVADAASHGTDMVQVRSNPGSMSRYATRIVGAGMLEDVTDPPTWSVGDRVSTAIGLSGLVEEIVEDPRRMYGLRIERTLPSGIEVSGLSYWGPEQITSEGAE